MSQEASPDRGIERLSSDFEEWRQRRLEAFDRGQLAWLALLPAWTQRLALACGFAPDAASLEAFLREAEGARLCARDAPGRGAAALDVCRAKILIVLAPHLSQALIPEAFERALSIGDDRSCSAVLSALAPHLPAHLLARALDAVRDIGDDTAKSDALAGLTPQLDRALADAALDIADSVADGGARVKTLIGLAPRVSPERRRGVASEALELARGCLSIEEQVRAQTKLAALLPGPGGEALLGEALAMSHAIGDEPARLGVLLELAAAVPEGLVPEVLEQARSIKDEVVRAQALVGITQHLSDGPKHEALAAALSVQDERARSELLIGIARHLPSTDFEQAFAATRRFVNEANRARVLIGISQHLPDTLMNEALTAAQTIGNARAQAGVLAKLAARLPPQLVTQALAAAGGIGDEWARAKALTELVSVLPDDSAEITHLEILDAVARIKDENDRATAVINLAGRLPAGRAGSIWKKVSEVVTGMSSPGARARALAELIPSYPEGMRARTVKQALSAAHSIKEEAARAHALIRLLPQLPEGERLPVAERAFEYLQLVADESERAEVLSKLAPYMDDRLLRRAFELARGEREAEEFWMPNAVRPEVLEYLDRVEGTRFLLKRVVELGRRLDRAKNKDHVPVPLATEHWGELGVQAGVSLKAAAQRLTSQMQALIAAGEIGKAQVWVNTGAALARVLGGPLEPAVLLCNRRLELAFRRKQDDRHLVHFLRRGQQVADFERLMQGPEDAWALHYLGAGGIGKTMLLRYISARLAPEYDALTCRVDFDHLSPDYPARKPGQILIELAEELRLHAGSPELEHKFVDLENAVVELHETLGSDPPAGDPLAHIHSPQFQSALRPFNEILGLLPRRVVLILDTCEELAKLRPAATRLPNIEATFGIIEQVHAANPRTRVIFAGRRHLALSGYAREWEVDRDAYPGASKYLPPNKSYLLLHEMTGFEEAEADQYFKLKGLEISEGMKRAVLERSREVGGAPRIIRRDARRAEAREYYNPFDLALYSDWVREDPNIDENVIASGETDPYVEMRIVNRIRRPETRAVLPAVILLQRFNRDMLRPASGASDFVFDEIIRDLSGLEWISYQPDNFLEVDRNLHPRLLKYYLHSSKVPSVEAAKRRLAPGLAEAVRQRGLDKLCTEHIEAALRLLPPAEAAELWENVSRRIPFEKDWSWARQVADRVLGHDSGPGVEDATLQLTMLATRAAAQLHEKPGLDLSADWSEVRRKARAVPDKGVREWLKNRGLAGIIASSRRAGMKTRARQAVQLWKLLEKFPQEADRPRKADSRYRTEQLAASICAALETIVEGAESSDAPSLIPDAGLLAEWAARLGTFGFPGHLASFAASLAGRALALSGDWHAARAAFEKSTQKTPPDGKLPPQYWADWCSPTSLTDRVRLEALRVLCVRSNVLEEFDCGRWLEEAADRLKDIDAERLCSLVLKLKLARGPLPAHELERFAAAESYDLERQPAGRAHELVPPLFATLAKGWLALGMAERALEYLSARSAQANETRQDESTVRQTEVLRQHVMRRMRLTAKAPATPHRKLTPAEARARMAAQATTASTFNSAPSTPPPAEAELFHYWWRTQCALTKKAAANLVSAAEAPALDFIRMTAGEHDLLEHSLSFDWREAKQLAQHAGRRLNDISSRFDPWKWWDQQPLKPELGFRLLLRRNALHDGVVSLEPWLSVLGQRRAAELALEEGELLALRLPERAHHLLALSRVLFKQAGDNVGVVIASIRMMIAYVHAGDAAAATATYDNNVRPSYKWLTQERPLDGLPLWRELRAWGAEPSAAGELNHPSWGGWLLRLFSCVLWAEERMGNLRDATPAREKIAEQFNKVVPLELNLSPAEWAGEAGPRAWKPRLGWFALDYALAATILLSCAGLAATLAWSVYASGLSPATLLTFFLTPLVFSGAQSIYRRLRGLLLPQMIAARSIPPRGQETLQTDLSVLDLGLPGAVTGSDADGSPADEDLRRHETRVALIDDLFGFLNPVGIALAGLLILTLGYFAVDYVLLSNLLPEGLGRHWKVMGYVLVLGSLVLIPWSFRKSRQFVEAWAASRSSVAMNIETVSEASEQIAPGMPAWVKVDLLYMEPAIWPLIEPFGRGANSAMGQLVTPGVKTFAPLSKGTADRVFEQLESLQARLRGLELPVHLFTAPAVSHIPWEGLLMCSLSEGDPLACPFQFYRRESEPGPYSDGDREWRTGDVAFIGSRSWNLMVEQGWSHLDPRVTTLNDTLQIGRAVRARESASLERVEAPAPLSSPDVPARLKVLHLVGTAVNTGGGMRLQIGGGKKGESAATQTRARDEGSKLIAAGMFKPDLAFLTVVQADPADVRLRLESDREHAARLRSFAAELFAVGMPAVLMLPELPLDLSEEVLTVLAKDLNVAAKPSPRQLLNLVSRVRRTIGRWRVHSSTAAAADQIALAPVSREKLESSRVEAALEVSFFCRAPHQEFKF